MWGKEDIMKVVEKVIEEEKVGLMTVQLSSLLHVTPHPYLL